MQAAMDLLVRYGEALGAERLVDTDNVVAAGRCIDADTEALSALRVMGICIAMGMAPPTRSTWRIRFHVVDTDALQERLSENLDRTD